MPTRKTLAPADDLSPQVRRLLVLGPGGVDQTEAARDPMFGTVFQAGLPRWLELWTVYGPALRGWAEAERLPRPWYGDYFADYALRHRGR